MTSREIQYELWRECNTKCSFCTLGNDNCRTSNDLKLKSLETAIEEIQQFNKGEHEILGFIGGDFFQGEINTIEVETKFIELIELCNDLLTKEYINELWLNATLTIGKHKLFYKILDILSNNHHKLWILTSYDTMGRFHSNKMKSNWEYNMNTLTTLYPTVRKNTTIILTQDFLERYNNDEFNIKDFRKQYNTTLFFKNPAGSKDLDEKQTVNDTIGKFFPTRKKYLDFLFKFKNIEDQEIYDNIVSSELRAEEVRKNLNDNINRNVKFIRNRETMSEIFYIDGTTKEQIVNEHLKCGHNMSYAGYIDSNDCMICDRNKMRNL